MLAPAAVVAPLAATVSIGAGATTGTVVSSESVSDPRRTERRTRAVPLLREFAVALNRHLAFEDGELAVSLGAAQAPSDQPAAIMLREHRDIAQQLSLVEETLAVKPVDGSELGIYCAILSGTLAKHEYREEHNLFPLWRVALSRRNLVERTVLLEHAKCALAAWQGISSFL